MYMYEFVIRGSTCMYVSSRLCIRNICRQRRCVRSRLLSPSVSSHACKSFSAVQIVKIVSNTWISSPARRVLMQHVNTFDLLPHCRWMSVVHGCPLSVIGPSLLLLPVVGSWNSPPQHVTSAPSTCMSVFWGCLKAFLFRRSFPWLCSFCSACAVAAVISDT